MLARLLRYTFLVQTLIGAMLGTWGAMELAPRWGVMSLGLVIAGALGWVLFWQLVVIAVSMLHSRPSGPLTPWLKAFWGEYTAALLIFGLRLPWATRNPDILAPTGQAKPGQTALPVLLVHGYVCNHRVWDKVAKALRQAGHPVLAIDLEPLFTSIDDYAPLIERAVLHLCAQTGAPRVVLVGHSMGGLAIRAWLRAHGTANVAKVITLGTPHQGTRVQQWVSTPNGAQMAYRSPWVTQLDSSETPAHRQLMHVALTHHDNIVHPQREQVLNGAAVTEFSAIGHLQMCLDNGVIAWLLQQIETTS
jgi:pimeloyl-ACP methyl ester carboxylesterase